MKLLVLLAAFGALAVADDSDNTLEVALSFVKDCRSGNYFLCVKEKLLRIVDNVRAARSITIAEGLILKGDPENRTPKKFDPLPVDPTVREAEVNDRLVDGVFSVFETHSLELKMNDADKETIQRSLEEGRGQKGGKKGGGMGAIIGLLGAKMLLGKLLIVKLIALKALATAKIALVLAVILFVAWCLKHDHAKTTYEVIPHAHHHESHHPVHVEHVSHGGHDHGYSSFGSDWSKNLDEAHNLAYGGYSGHSK
ncbi:hypothetical protein EVAR_12290_1 [Eumeta japonica]|uniref:Osiris 9 n=1 Tax=Eumeta variegata TaxID=151549 RepID=A0A4C1TUA1_EUMVA|nr:hypothetical protein EVAR_12290_1 [Eumeta japonica]